ncbi:hypothetical protein L3Q82_005489 [Scortum barcoo]|uniref:Uncharacterized protein n=1 Tax=Scortum barcoo TaxID=214431 RepID=A0ACB8VB07_9TELE|nr:hypothetical protein L3Q82_005489 [Scortum barcoo]
MYLLAVSIRPYYLPREFPHVITITTYIPPSAKRRCSLRASPQCCGTASDRASSSLSPHHRGFEPRFPVCHSPQLPPGRELLNRDNKTLDLLSANTAGLQLITPPPAGPLRPQPGPSAPCLHTYGEETAPQQKACEAGSEEARDALRDCFDTTDWEVLCGPHEQDIDSLTDCITDYIKLLCRNHRAHQEGRAFLSGDRDELRRVQRDLKQKIKECKASYRRKMEDHLQQNNAREVWRGLQAISGQGKNERRNPEPGDRDWANKLNLFFNRFDTGPTSTPLSLSTDQPNLQLPLPARPLTTINTSTISGALTIPPPSPPSLQCSSPPPPPSPNLFTPTVDQVRTQLKKIKARKATGPDGISSRLLRDCADQLCQVVCYIFNLSLSLERVPVLWKTSCVVPVPKTSRPKELQPLQTRGLNFSPDEGTGEDRPQAPPPPVLSTRIHPSLLRVKLERAGASDQLAAWVTNYLTDRPQFVRLQDCVSDVVVCSTGAPQGTVLSPFLFTLYTSDFTYSTDSCHLQKFSDDTAIVGCVSEGNDCEYRKVIMDFVDWCELNHLQVNASKTKEMVIDFSRKPSSADIAPAEHPGT